MFIIIGTILLLAAIILWYLPGLFFINFWLPRKNKPKQELVMRDSQNQIVKAGDMLRGNGPCYCRCEKIEIIGEDLIGTFGRSLEDPFRINFESLKHSKWVKVS